MLVAFRVLALTFASGVLGLFASSPILPTGAVALLFGTLLLLPCFLCDFSDFVEPLKADTKPLKPICFFFSK